MEKELNIVYNQEGNIANISTNFQEDLDAFEPEEITTIIIDLLNSVSEKIKRNVVEEEIGEKSIDDIEDNEAQQIFEKASEETSDFVGKLIYDILNFINNKHREEPQEFDYSLTVYDIDKSNNVKEVYETFHYGNLKNHEKLLGCFAFYKDIASELLRQNNSKENVKLLLKKTFGVMLFNIYNHIDKYDLNEK